jgi:hypothetical protein
MIIRGGNEGGLDGIDVSGFNMHIHDIEVTNKDECVTVKVNGFPNLKDLDSLLTGPEPEQPFPHREHLLQLVWRLRNRIPWNGHRYL